MFYCTGDQITYIFTKALSREHFEKNILELGMIKIAWTALLSRNLSFAYDLSKILINSFLHIEVCVLIPELWMNWKMCAFHYAEILVHTSDFSYVLKYTWYNLH